MQTLAVANWKMNGTIEESLKLVTELKNKIEDFSLVEIAVAPPFTALYSVQVVLQDTPFKLAAQNMHWESEGAYTGEISPAFLKDVGCAYVIIGHSERRRYFGETDETVNRKIQEAIASELIPIFCIGETAEERRSGKMEMVLERQIKKGLRELHMPDLKDLVIAYEPVWAIGTGETATTAQIEQAHQFVRDLLAKGYDAPTANGVRLLYGGSVTPENSKTIFQVKNVDGVLVGSASLSAEKFVKIVRSKE
ncbi:MAG: triose-phosphate isomerase [Deltaproteobacteria bacterium]|nr:triose-phosphate isomerase [Deltaproteobacteria bacterium]